MYEFQPIVCRPASSCNHKNNLWVFPIVVSDQSLSGVKMILDSCLIDKFLGFTVEDARKAAENNDLEMKKKFGNEANRMYKIFSTRLDFIFEVEFSPNLDDLPVIKKFDSLGKVLNII